MKFLKSGHFVQAACMMLGMFVYVCDSTRYYLDLQWA